VLVIRKRPTAPRFPSVISSSKMHISVFRYDFKDASEGIDKTVGGTEYTAGDLEMPEEFPELERPALRKIDKYCTPECPCCNLSKRYTQVSSMNLQYT
jgi:hypothetical protein